MKQLVGIEDILPRDKLVMFMTGYKTHQPINIATWLKMADEVRGSKQYKMLMKKK